VRESSLRNFTWPPLSTGRKSGPAAVGAHSARRKPELVPVPAAHRPAADQHPALVYLASLAPGSRRGVSSSLQVCAELLSSGRCDGQTLPWQALGPQHTQALRSELADRYSAPTANKVLDSVRGVLRAAWELGQIDTNRYQRAIGFRAVRGQTLPRGRSISQGELRALFSNCLKDKAPMGVRDAALLAVLYVSGLRRAEATALDVVETSLGSNRSLVSMISPSLVGFV
jgi:hypothetical protein